MAKSSLSVCKAFFLVAVIGCAQTPLKETLIISSPAYEAPHVLPPNSSAPGYFPFNQSKTVFITGSRVNIRSDASTVAEIISCLPRGSALTGLGEKDCWYRVRLRDGREGYVHTQYSSLSRPVARKSVPSENPPPPSFIIEKPLSPTPTESEESQEEIPSIM